jgi:LysR family transcriptional regulator, carnitine catabolism transcriptional activator
MTLKQLQAFLAVARTQSFAEACNLVHLSQPALSLAIKNLEDDLGGRLFARTTRTLSLTSEGQAFMPIASRLVTDWSEAQRQMQQRFAMQLGTVELASMPSFASTLLPQALLRYKQRYPRIRIEVQDVVAETLVNMVLQGRIELGVSFEPGNHSELDFYPLFNDSFVAVLPPDHALAANADSIEWQQLLQSDFVMLQRPSRLRSLIEEQLAEHGMQASVVFEAHQLATVGQMVATGLGVSVVPSLSRQQMQALGARCVNVQAPVIGRQVGIITRNKAELSVAAAAMKAIIVETFGHGQALQQSLPSEQRTPDQRP